MPSVRFDYVANTPESGPKVPAEACHAEALSVEVLQRALREVFREELPKWSEEVRGHIERRSPEGVMPPADAPPPLPAVAKSASSRRASLSLFSSSLSGITGMTESGEGAGSSTSGPPSPKACGRKVAGRKSLCAGLGVDLEMPNWSGVMASSPESLVHVPDIAGNESFAATKDPTVIRDSTLSETSETSDKNADGFKDPKCWGVHPLWDVMMTDCTPCIEESKDEDSGKDDEDGSSGGRRTSRMSGLRSSRTSGPSPQNVTTKARHSSKNFLQQQLRTKGSQQLGSQRMSAVSGWSNGIGNDCETLPSRPYLVWAARIVYQPFFEFASGCVILLNAILIGFESDYSLRHINRGTPIAFVAAKWTTTLLFVLELLLRVLADGPQFFTLQQKALADGLPKKRWLWDVMDILIVVCQVLDCVVSSFLASWGGVPGTLTLLRSIRLPGLIRSVSLLRLLRFCQELGTLVDCISNTFRSLFSTVLLLFMLTYTVGVYAVSLIVDQARERPWILEGDSGLRSYYGSLSRAILSLFQATTGGVDWNDILSPLTKDISPLLALPLCLYVAFTVLAMMNVITGIFVESALSAAKGLRDTELREKMCRLFLEADMDQSGMITWEEFSAYLQDENMERCFELLDMDISEARGLFTLLDTDCCGEVDTEEFVMGCLRLQGAAKAIDLATLMYFNKRISNWWQLQMADVHRSLAEVLSSIQDLKGEAACAPSTRGSVVMHSKSDGENLDRRTSLTSGSSQVLANYATWASLKGDGKRGGKRCSTMSAISSQPEDTSNSDELGSRRSMVRRSTITGSAAAAAAAAEHPQRKVQRSHSVTSQTAALRNDHDIKVLS